MLAQSGKHGTPATIFQKMAGLIKLSGGKKSPDVLVPAAKATFKVNGKPVTGQVLDDGNTRTDYIQWNPEPDQEEFDKATTCSPDKVAATNIDPVKNDKQQKKNTKAFRKLAIDQKDLKDSIKACDVKGCGSGGLAGKASAKECGLFEERFGSQPKYTTEAAGSSGEKRSSLLQARLTNRPLNFQFSVE